jgi:putative hydrolase of the HAD superfamily
MIKAVIFDFGQTLVDSAEGFRSAEKKAKEEIFLSLFSSSSDDQYQTYLNEYRQIRNSFHARSEFSRVSIWQAVYERFNCKADLKKLTQMESEYWELVQSKTAPFPETVSVLEKLAKKFQLGIITNTQGQKSSGSHRITLFPGIEIFFEAIVVAGESGLPAKPDPAPFLLCLKKMNLKPAEAIYVGDDFQKDVNGAGSVGLHPIWIKHNLVKRTWPEPESHFKYRVISDLNQLLEIDRNGMDS